MMNLEIRQKIKESRLRHYEVAQQMGMSEYTLSVWLRKELSNEKKSLLLRAIESLMQGGGASEQK